MSPCFNTARWMALIILAPDFESGDLEAHVPPSPPLKCLPEENGEEGAEFWGLPIEIGS